MIKKQMLKSRPVCKVTFTLPEGIDATTASVVGDFNDWNPAANPLQKQKTTGLWRTTIELEKDRSYQFRYYVNNSEWYNDAEADAFQTNEHGSENSVLRTS